MFIYVPPKLSCKHQMYRNHSVWSPLIEDIPVGVGGHKTSLEDFKGTFSEKSECSLMEFRF